MMSTLKTPKEDSREFRAGERVRIFLGYVTDAEIHIREGTVIEHRKNRIWARSYNYGYTGNALVLRVEKTGILIRKDPRKIAVFHRRTGYWVRGQLELKTLRNPYKRPYFYDCISGAERIIIRQT